MRAGRRKGRGPLRLVLRSRSALATIAAALALLAALTLLLARERRSLGREVEQGVTDGVRGGLDGALAPEKLRGAAAAGTRGIVDGLFEAATGEPPPGPVEERARAAPEADLLRRGTGVAARGAHEVARAAGDALDEGLGLFEDLLEIERAAGPPGPRRADRGAAPAPPAGTGSPGGEE